MLKISKIIKILFVLFVILFFINNMVSATNINMNLPSNETYNTYENGTETNNIDDSNATTNEMQNTDISNSTIDASGTTAIQDDIGGTAAPSSVGSIAEEDMSFSNILNILLITVGVVLILLAIAILIRLKS